MSKIFQVIGFYQEPYYSRWYPESDYPRSEDEMDEEIHYRHHRPIEKTLGFYSSESEAEDAKQRFEEYEVAVRGENIIVNPNYLCEAG